MGWLRLVGSLNLHVSFAKYRLFYKALLQKRPMILRSLLIVATRYHISRSVFFLCFKIRRPRNSCTNIHAYTCACIHTYIYVCVCIYVHVYVCVNVYVHVYVSVYIYVPVYVCVDVYV